MSTQQIEQHLGGGAGMRRRRNEMEGGDDTRDAPPPKPTTRVISSGQATEPNDMNMAEVPTPTA
eukprot:4950810-Prymnesium_polylepis.1